MSVPAETSVLLVDDDPDIRRILQFTLAAEGYEVNTAADGDEAVAMAADLVPDVMLLDVMMPGRDGYGVLEEVRANPETQAIRVLMLSAKATDDDVWAGWRAGADCYLTKPFDITQILEFVAAEPIDTP
jgi:DNA-binding response OmpR family regulator